jgi:hypothetical protein
MWRSLSIVGARAVDARRGLGRLGLLAVVATLLVARPAHAVDVQFDAVAQNSQANTRTLRIPATGTFNPAANARFLTVTLAISDANHSASVVWYRVDGAGAIMTSEIIQGVVARDTDPTGAPCRSLLFARSTVSGSGPGYVMVTVAATSGNPPAPSLAGTVMSFANVATTWIDPPCCNNASNDGSDTTAATKTMAGLAKGDIAVSAVCTAWTGTAPGTPTPDVSVAPEMVARAFSTAPGTAKLQHFTSTSPGSPLLIRPRTGTQHLRWAQSGSRNWALVAVGLLSDDVLNPPGPDAGAMDMGGPAPMDMGGPAPVDMGGAVEPGPPGDGGGDVAQVPDSSPGTGGGGGASGGGPSPTGGAGGDPTLPMTADGGSSNAGPVDWRVGCACELGAAGPRSGVAGWLAIASATALILRRRSR